jgi:hypothetical protein
MMLFVGVVRKAFVMHKGRGSMHGHAQAMHAHARGVCTVRVHRC